MPIPDFDTLTPVAPTAVPDFDSLNPAGPDFESLSPVVAKGTPFGAAVDLYGALPAVDEASRLPAFVEGMAAQENLPDIRTRDWRRENLLREQEEFQALASQLPPVPKTALELWTRLPLAPVLKPQVKPDDSFLAGFAKESAAQLLSVPEFMTTGIGVLTLGAGAASPILGPTASKLVHGGIRYGFLADILYNFFKQAPQDVDAWSKATPGEKGAMLSRWMGTAALGGSLAGPEIGRGLDATRRVASELARPVAPPAKPVTPYQRGEKPPGYRAPFEPVPEPRGGGKFITPTVPSFPVVPVPPPSGQPVVEKAPPVPRSEAVLPPESAKGAETTGIGGGDTPLQMPKIGDARRLALSESTARGENIPAAAVEPAEFTALLEPAGYVKEGDVYVRRSLLDAPKTEEPKPAEPKIEPPPVPPVRPAAARVAVGAEWKASTPVSGDKVSGQWEVVDLGDILTSSHPEFDQVLQPRDRSRAASKEQIAKIAAGLEPERLGESPTTDNGAPILDEFNQALTGNGRLAALTQVYAAGSERAGAYQHFVQTQAAKLGIDPAKIAGMASPVLVRRVADYGKLSKPDFARLSNESQVLGMSAAEKAGRDAQMLRDNPGLAEAFLPSEEGDVLAASNRGFLQAFVQGTGERAELLNADGSFNVKTLGPRVKNAVLGALLGGENRGLLNDLVDRAAELNIAKASTGVMAAAPRLLKHRGTVYDLGATLGQALGDLVRIRTEGLKVAEFIDQGTLFADPQRTAETNFLLEQLAGSSAKQIAEGLARYADLAGKMDLNTGDMFGATPAPRPELLRKAYENANAKGPIQENLFTRKPEPPTREPEGPAAAPGGGVQASPGFESRGGETSDFLTQLTREGFAETQPMGEKVMLAWERALANGRDGELPIEYWVRGITDAQATFDPRGRSVTVDVAGYTADLKTAHETVTVTVTDDGAIRMFASGGREPALLKAAVAVTERVLRGQEKAPVLQQRTLTDSESQASPPAIGGGDLGAEPSRTAPEADARHSVLDAVPMEMPEAVQVIKALTGSFPRIRERLRALGGQAAGVFRFSQGEGAKGRVSLRADIFELLTAEDKARLRQEAQDYATANKLGVREARAYLDQLTADAIEAAKSKNPLQAMKVIWHEIGHVVDWLPDHFIRGRGNLFGRLGSLKNYLKHTFPIDPDRPAGKKLTPAEQTKLRRAAAEAMQAEIGPMREIIETIMVEEPVYRELQITPDMVKRLYGLEDMRSLAPELYRWFAEQPAAVKVEIVRAAMKGMLDERLKAVSGKEQIGTRKVEKEVRQRVGRMPTPAEIEAKFKEMLWAEMLKRNLADLKTIKAEMEPVIAWWRGTDKMEEYFRPSDEMYAEAFSVFANNPAALAARAPTYARMLWNYLERKPEVRALYDQIQSDIKSGRVQGNRVQALRAMFDGDARTSLDLERERAKITGRDFVDNVRYHIDRRFGPVYRLARGYAREGAVREAIGSFLYRATEHERFLGNLNDAVGKPLVRYNLDWSDLGEYLFHQRVSKERFNLANPLGWTSKNSQERLAELQKDLGPLRWSALEQAGAEFRRIYADQVTTPLGAERMFTPELQAILDARAHYATFSAIKGIPDSGLERILETQYGASVTPHIYRQIGMTGEIKNPATATVLKGLSLITANLRNTAKREIVEMLRAQDPESIAPARMRWTGKHREPVIVETPQVGTVVYLKDGEASAWYVRRNVAEAINAGNAHENLAFSALRNGVGWMKGLFTQLNYAFWPVNFVRDTLGWQMQLPGASPLAYAKVFPRALAAARLSVTRARPNKYSEDVLRRRMVISQNDPRGVWAAADNEFDLRVARMGMDPAAWSKEAGDVGRVVKLWQHYREIGQTIERVNKIAGMIHLDEKYPDMPEWKKREIVRERAGSPNFLERGASNPYMDMFALFYNPWKEGVRSVVKSAAENPWQFGAKATVLILTPTLLQSAAVNGWLGDEWKKRYRSVTDYDLTNYLILPPKWADENQGKAAYVRLPLWEPARVMHGILFQALTDRGQGIGSFAGGQLPGLNPVLQSGLAWLEYAQGNNPADLHRGTGILTDDEQRARGETSLPALTAMGKWTWNTMGGSVLNRFQNLNLESPPETTAEKFLALPGLNNLLGRWVKVSNRGLFDAARVQASGPVAAHEAAIRLALQPMLDKLAKGEPWTAAEWSVMRDPVAMRYLLNKFPDMMASQSSPALRMLLDVQSSAQKAALLQHLTQ